MNIEDIEKIERIPIPFGTKEHEVNELYKILFKNNTFMIITMGMLSYNKNLKNIIGIFLPEDYFILNSFIP